MSANTEDITGLKFGKLTAIKNSGRRTKCRHVIWEFSCDCGNTSEHSKSRVVCGTVISCGCAIKDALVERNTKHGMRWTKEYSAWRSAKERTKTSSGKNKEYYADRGISMSNEFAESFETFYEHIGAIPASGKHSLGRIDNSKGYERGNVRWETDAQQARNRGFFRHNTSGVTGVCWRVTKTQKMPATYAVAFWRDLDGKHKTKSFPVSKLGLLPAFAEAVKYREKMISELNLQGADYSNTHGKKESV